MTNKPEVLTVEEVAEYLRRNPDVVRRWLRQGKLPGKKVGGSWMVKRSDLDRFLSSEVVPQ